MIELLSIAAALVIVAAVGVPLVIRYTKAKREMTEDDDIKIYDPKKDHINADQADRCNHGR